MRLKPLSSLLKAKILNGEVTEVEIVHAEVLWLKSVQKNLKSHKVSSFATKGTACETSPGEGTSQQGGSYALPANVEVLDR